MNKPKPIHSLLEVAYFQASESYSLMVFADGRVLVKSRPMKKYEPELTKNGWCKIHRSYMVNPQYVQHISEDRDSIFLQNGKVLPISRRQKLSVISWRSKIF
jgi:two-component system, LytTR family, response regulator